MPRLPDPRTSDAIDIDAPADVVWSVYSDVVHWPEWTESVTSVELEPGREWVWENKSPGASSVAAHSVRADGERRTHVELWIDQRGVIGRAVGLLVRRMTRNYLRMEAEGLKRRSESLAGEQGGG